jgi:predicted RNA-binding Zn ribbon-like protein
MYPAANSAVSDADEPNDVRPPFVFLAGVLALDFVNTDVVIRSKPRDFLAEPADLAAWWQAALDHHAVQVEGVDKFAQAGPDSLGDAKVLRKALRGIFTAVAHSQPVQQADLAILNQVLRTGHASLTLAPDGRFLPLYRTDHSADERVRFAIALSAFELLSEGDLSRLHKCKNERCVLLFYDTTKSATRRWCSTDCMNRARSIENYRRSRV